MTQRKGKNKDIRTKGGYEYESAYSAAGSFKLDPREARQSRNEVLEEELERRETPRETRERLRREKEKARTKKHLIIIAAAVLVAAAGVLAALFFVRRAKEAQVPEDEIQVLEIESQKANVEELYTYGTHLNMTGTLPAAALEEKEGLKIDLVLYDGDFISVPVIINDNTFTLAEKYNGGLYLDDIPRGTYTMFIRVSQTEPLETETTTESEETEETESTTEDPKKPQALEKKKEETQPETEEAESDDPNAVRYYRYYAISNGSGYPETVYYTMSSFDSRIVIGSETEYPTMQMDISESTDDNVYDVVIDPAHGGKDPGAAGVNGKKEIDYLLPLALKIKSDLEAEGVKVALTRESDTENLEIYGDDGRIDRACSVQAKYMLSLHMNDSGQGMEGLEIYANPNIDLTFAELMNDKIQEATSIGDSSNIGKVGNNIYVKSLSQSDVDSMTADNTAAGLKPYEPVVGSSYHYIIRETGGIVTGAFRDGRNPKEKYNRYCDDNTCLETYILQLGYITSWNDQWIMDENMDNYAKAIADSIMSVYGEGYPEPETEESTENAG